MHILYHHRTMARGAEGIHILNIVNEFEKSGHAVTILSPPGVANIDTFGSKPLDKTDEKVSGLNKIWRIISKKAPQVLFELLEIVYNLTAFFRLRKIVQQKEVDMIYERNAYYLFAAALVSWIYKIPLIIEANEVVGVESARKLKMPTLAGLFEKFVFRHAHAIFTVSSYLKNKIDIITNDAEKTYLTPNAINPDNFQKTTKRTTIRNRYHIDDKIVIGFAGWFDWWDRLDISVQIQAELLKQGYTDTVTMLVGDGPPMESIRKEVQELGLDNHIILTGSIEKKVVADFIDAFDIGLFAHSNAFGSPVVLFEMMALRKCIVAPSLMPFADVIIDGKNGLLFEPENKEMIFETITSLIRDRNKVRQVGDQAYEHVMANYTWKKNAQKILSTIK